MKILPEDKVTVKQVKDAFFEFMDTSEGPYREMNPAQKRNNWGMFWIKLTEQLKKNRSSVTTN